jgi:SagB-type dehydrogenase family enzyme
MQLPEPEFERDASLMSVIAGRRSVRDFSPLPLTPVELSGLLWAAQGFTDRSGLRAAPSAGATFPLEVFVCLGPDSVTGIGEGIYHYEPKRHSLTRHHKADVRRDLARAAIGQDFIYQAPVTFAIAAVPARTTHRYGTRGERYVYIEAGHAGQNLYLAAGALGLATVGIGAFKDEAVGEVLHLGRELKPVYLLPVGRPA